MRCIIVKGVNDLESHYRGIAEIYSGLKNCRGVELMPCHAFGGSKQEALTGCDNGNTQWIPNEDDMNFAKGILKKSGVRVL